MRATQILLELRPASLRCTSNRHRYNVITRTNHHSSSSSTKDASPTLRSRLQTLRSNGTPEILLGSTVLFLAAIDYTLQQRNNDNRDKMMRHLEQTVQFDAEVSRNEIEQRNHPALFQCVVRRVPSSFDGHKCLTNVNIGDVLNVMEERVGPGGQYHLCSMDGDETTKNGGGGRSMGWFPCSCLEPIQRVDGGE